MNMTTTPDIEYVPLSDLHLSDLNTRKTRDPDPAAVAALAANIQAEGLIQNLVVVPEKVGRKRGLGVIAGGRRFEALCQLLDAKQIDAAYLVPIKRVTQADAIAISAAENMHREAMHPADEFEAWAALVDAGRTVEQVALANHVEPSVVRRTLRLARLAPDILAAYRARTLDDDQVQALTLTDDHALQCRFLNARGGAPAAHSIRRQLTEGAVPSSDPRVQLVGRATYEDAGGAVRVDMFAADGEFYVEDVALLDQLVAAKLTKAADKQRSKYPWVEIHAETLDYSTRESYRPIPTIRVTPTDEQRAEMVAVTKERDRIEAKMEQEDDEDKQEALSEKWDAADARLAALDAALRVPDPEAVAAAGVVVAVGHNGKIEYLRDVVRASQLRAIRSKHQTSAGADASEGNDTTGPVDPTSLARELSGLASVAAQEAVASNPATGLRVLALALVTAWPEFRGYADPLGCTRAMRPATIESSPVLASSQVEQSREARRAQWESLLPLADEDSLWNWLNDADEATVIALLAYCVARTIDGSIFANTQTSEAVRLAGRIGLDLHTAWQPNAAYFARLTKARTLGVLSAYGKREDGHAKLKRDALSEHAAHALESSGYLPPTLMLDRTTCI